MRAPFHSLLLLPLLAAPAAAQPLCNGRESSGPFAGTPIATVVHGMATDQIHFRSDGFGNKYEEFPGLPPNKPDLDIQAILEACGAIEPPVIDAMSMCDDWVLADCSGVVDVPQGRWGSVLFSVTPGSKGKIGTPLGAETTAGPAESDVFSYVLPGSVLPSALVGRTQRALDSSETSLSPRDDVAALDLFLPSYLLDDRVGTPFPQGMMPQSMSFCFSLTSESAKKVPVWWFNRSFGAPTQPSGATILRMDWQPANGWRCPYAWFTYADLSLIVEEDIDALGVDLGNQRMLFSTDISIVARDPILVFSWACPTDAIPQTYTEPGPEGTPVSDAIGLAGSADVDAICAMDPSVMNRPGTPVRPNSAYYVHGTPTRKAFPFRPLNGSGYRQFENGLIKMRTHLVGWPTGQAGPGVGLCFVTASGSLSPAVGIASFSRPMTVFCGDPLNTEVAITPAVLPFVEGVPFLFRWFAIDSTTGTPGEGYPVEVRF